LVQGVRVLDVSFRVAHVELLKRLEKKIAM
jgi:hypothetical protein